MRAYNRKIKPKHTTKPRWKRGLWLCVRYVTIKNWKFISSDEFPGRLLTYNLNVCSKQGICKIKKLLKKMKDEFYNKEK